MWGWTGELMGLGPAWVGNQQRSGNVGVCVKKEYFPGRETPLPQYCGGENRSVGGEGRERARATCVLPSLPFFRGKAQHQTRESVLEWLPEQLFPPPPFPSLPKPHVNSDLSRRQRAPSDMSALAPWLPEKVASPRRGNEWSSISSE